MRKKCEPFDPDDREERAETSSLPPDTFLQDALGWFGHEPRKRRHHSLLPPEVNTPLFRPVPGLTLLP